MVSRHVTSPANTHMEATHIKLHILTYFGSVTGCALRMIYFIILKAFRHPWGRALRMFIRQLDVAGGSDGWQGGR